MCTNELLIIVVALFTADGVADEVLIDAVPDLPKTKPGE